MAISETLRQLDDAILDLEVTIRKAQVMTDDLSGGYFELKKGLFICAFHDEAGIKNSISLDYIIKIAELIKTARELIDVEREAAKEREES